MFDNFKQSCRRALVSFRDEFPHDTRKTETFFPDEEPTLVPEGMYAVVTVELRQLDPIKVDALEAVEAVVA